MIPPPIFAKDLSFEGKVLNLLFAFGAKTLALVPIF